MKKRNTILVVGLPIALVLILLVLAANINSPVAKGSQATEAPHITHLLVSNATGAQFSGDDLYDPSIHPSLLITQQACAANVSSYESYKPAVALNCAPSAP